MVQEVAMMNIQEVVPEIVKVVDIIKLVEVVEIISDVIEVHLVHQNRKDLDLEVNTEEEEVVEAEIIDVNVKVTEIMIVLVVKDITVEKRVMDLVLNVFKKLEEILALEMLDRDLIQGTEGDDKEVEIQVWNLQLKK